MGFILLVVVVVPVAAVSWGLGWWCKSYAVDDHENRYFMMSMDEDISWVI